MHAKRDQSQKRIIGSWYCSIGNVLEEYMNLIRMSKQINMELDRMQNLKKTP